MKRLKISLSVVTVFVILALGILPTVMVGTEGGKVSGMDYVKGNHALGAKSATRYDYHSSAVSEGDLLTFTISATDSDNDPLIYSASNLPPGATFDPETKTFSWTPGYDQAGVYPDVHFEVSDGELTDSEDITIWVYDVKCPPVLDTIGDKLAYEQELIEFEVSATDADNDMLTYKAYNLPPGASFDVQTRSFVWTPGFGQQGSYPGIRFEVSDGKLTDFEDIVITVMANAEVAFSVSDLKINPGEVNVGKKVNVRVIVSNRGTGSGSYEVTMRINGIIEDSMVVTLPAGIAKAIKFDTVKKAAGVYIVDVNGVSGSFVVYERDRSGSK
jgi:hypothetical protein